MTERVRHDIYYLERIHDAIVIHPDDTVGQIETKDVETTVRIPGRVEGREHVKQATIKALVQVALHDSLSAYQAWRRENTFYRDVSIDNSWTLEEMPSEVISEYEQWRDTLPLVDIEAVKRAAVQQSMIDRNDDETLSCDSCESGVEYMCRNCGYARRFYQHPIVRYHGEDEVRDMPFDVAQILADNPEALTIDTITKFDQRGRLMAERRLIFDVRQVHDGNDGVLRVDRGEDLAQPLSIIIDKFVEQSLREEINERVLSTYHGRTEFAQKLTTPQGCIDALQHYIAQTLYRERVTTVEDQARLTELRRRLGKHGLSLGSEWKYAGMGETDIELIAARVRKDGRVAGGMLTFTSDLQYAVGAALNRFKERSL